MRQVSDSKYQTGDLKSNVQRKNIWWKSPKKLANFEQLYFTNSTTQFFITWYSSTQGPKTLDKKFFI